MCKLDSFLARKNLLAKVYALPSHYPSPNNMPAAKEDVNVLVGSSKKFLSQGATWEFGVVEDSAGRDAGISILTKARSVAGIRAMADTGFEVVDASAERESGEVLGGMMKRVALVGFLLRDSREFEVDFEEIAGVEFETRVVAACFS